jgi:hypothetical protein
MPAIRCDNKPVPARSDCIGFTCMKWSTSGELSEIDLQKVMERLATVDPNLVIMSSCSLEEKPASNH